MPNQLTCLRVFIASPDGLEDERKAFRNEIQDYNETDAIARGVYFLAAGWEDTLAGVGRPQALINEDVCKSDYLVLLLWDRWGSPPDIGASRFSSGTEEEYDVALRCYEDEQDPMRQIVMMFKAVSSHQLSDPGTQLQRVLDFRKAIEINKQHLFHSFDSVEAFRKYLRKHLAAWLRDTERGLASKIRGSVGPLPDDAVPGEEFLDSPSVADQKPSSTDTAWQLANDGRLTEAEVEFSKLTAGRSDVGALQDYGRFLRRLGRLEQATVFFDRAATIASDQGDTRALAASYSGLGHVLLVRGNFPGAEQMYQKALELNEGLQNDEGTAANYGSLANVLRRRGDLARAEQMYGKALEIDEKLGNLAGIAASYGNIGVLLEKRGDFDGAEQRYRSALAIAEKVEDLEGMAIHYGNLGNVFAKRGDYVGADPLFRKALELDVKLGRPEGMAANYGNIAITLEKRGDLTGAEQMYRKALEINENLGRLEGVAINYSNLGGALVARNDLASAEQMYRKALEANEKLGLLQDLAKNYRALGEVLGKRGDLDGEKQMYGKALELDAQIKRRAVQSADPPRVSG